MNYAKIATTLHKAVEIMTPLQFLQKGSFYTHDASTLQLIGCCTVGAVMKATKDGRDTIQFIESGVGRDVVSWNDNAPSKDYVLAELRRLAAEASKLAATL